MGKIMRMIVDYILEIMLDSKNYEIVFLNC